MWNGIASVSSVITLVAFVAALLASAYRRRMLQKERMLKLVPQEQRGPLVESMLDRVSVDTKGLTREQRYDLAVRLIENRSRKFKLVTVWIGIIALLAAIVASLTLVQEFKEARERAKTTFSAQFPFQTGWIFLGYHDSWRWIEGPMARIVYRSEEGRKSLPLTEDGRAASTIEGMFHDLSDTPLQRVYPLDRRRFDYYPRKRSIQQMEDLIRYKQSFEEASPDSIPALGDVLRISKARRVVIADFRSKGLANQMSFPPLIKDPLNADDETGLQLETGSLVIIRDIELGAYPGRPAAVWCRVAACEQGIPQCELALETVRGSR